MVLLFAWLAISWDAFFPLSDVASYWLAGLLGGHTLAESVCLTQLAPEIRECRAAEAIVLYPLKWTNRLRHRL